MKNIQLVLSGGNVSGSDLSLCWSVKERTHSLFLGLALIQRLPGDHEHILHKLAVAQMVNAGMSLRSLAREFHHAPVTMKNWAEAAQSGDLERIAAAFSGRGAEKKVSEEIEQFVRGQYLALRHVYSDYRKRIAAAILKRFGKTVSGERLRQVFRQVDAEMVEATEPSCRPQEDDRAEDSSTPSRCPPASSMSDSEDNCEDRSEAEAERSLPQSEAPSSETPKKEFSAAPDSGVSDTKGCVQSPVLSTKVPVPRKYSCAPPFVPTATLYGGLPLSAFDPGGEPFMVHHAGQILFSPFLDVLHSGGVSGGGIYRQWLVQILQGAVNIEQSKTVCASSLSLLCGDCGADRHAQRRKLKGRADPEISQALFASGARLLRDGPGVGSVFYYDVHSVKYTGSKTILKGWAGARCGVHKVLHMDFIHTRSGDPCFAFHADNYYDLRERMFMVAKRFNDLCERCGQTGGKVRTWIIDRGIFGLDTFRGFTHGNNRLITWEKHYNRNGWDDSKPAALFRRCRERNRPGKCLWWEFSCQEGPWEKNPSIRRIIVRVRPPKGTPSEVSVLCTDEHMAVQEVVTLIFNRWIQENDFWYLERYMGIGQITSYASNSYAEIADTLRDRPMDCPEYRKMKRERAAQERKLGKQLVAQDRRRDRIRDAEAELKTVCKNIDDADEKLQSLCRGKSRDDSVDSEQINRLTTQIQTLKKKRTTLRRSTAALRNARRKAEERIQRFKDQNDELRRQMDLTLKTDSRIRILLRHNYRRLDTRAKAVMDALRITARNVFFGLHEVFRPIYQNYRDDHVILRELTRAPGVLRRSPGTDLIEVELRPKAAYSQAIRRKIDSFLEIMTKHINNHFTGRAETVKITLAENAASPIV